MCVACCDALKTSTFPHIPDSQCAFRVSGPLSATQRHVASWRSCGLEILRWWHFLYELLHPWLLFFSTSESVISGSRRHKGPEERRRPKNYWLTAPLAPTRLCQFIVALNWFFSCQPTPHWALILSSFVKTRFNRWGIYSSDATLKNSKQEPAGLINDSSCREDLRRGCLRLRLWHFICSSGCLTST